MMDQLNACLEECPQFYSHFFTTAYTSMSNPTLVTFYLIDLTLLKTAMTWYTRISKSNQFWERIVKKCVAYQSVREIGLILLVGLF